ncbi:hypothetical protein L1987_17995 [Smallanthus sonchifolius]|uniref:Uncharacterized protein n=1 Tax=Smallanthus sonchifolius TaxID=185202 RepID=A0ACB9J120_9ASTR|nr:hypothetical protein L1987_17995 [Smallanthus sonchifolius]
MAVVLNLMVEKARYSSLCRMARILGGGGNQQIETKPTLYTAKESLVALTSGGFGGAHSGGTTSGPPGVFGGTGISGPGGWISGSGFGGPGNSGAGFRDKGGGSAGFSGSKSGTLGVWWHTEFVGWWGFEGDLRWIVGYFHGCERW